MPLTSTVKEAAISFGLYRPARFLKRHIVARDQLAAFRDEIALFGSLVPADALCFDIGANVGEKTEALLAIGARVVAFEPQPQCVREIHARCGPNRRLTVLQAAIGSTPRIATLQAREDAGKSTLREMWQGECVGAVDVPLLTLDLAIARYGVPYYCKIDVEGWEHEVFRGLTSAVPLISFEYHTNASEGDQALACLDHLAQLGSLLVNVTFSEVPRLELAEWLPLAQFKEWFLRARPTRKGAEYGDIFVRTAV